MVLCSGSCKLSCPKKSPDCLESSCCRDSGLLRARTNGAMVEDIDVL